MADDDTQTAEDLLAGIDAFLAEFDPLDSNTKDCPPSKVANDGNVAHVLAWANSPDPL